MLPECGEVARCEYAPLAFVVFFPLPTVSQESYLAVRRISTLVPFSPVVTNTFKGSSARVKTVTAVSSVVTGSPLSV